MGISKRSTCLNEIKQSFHESGYVDWHISPRLSNDEPHEEENGDVAVQTAPPELKRPPLYAVVLMNDDYTPMDFVIEILQQYFALNLDQATQVMLTVHYEGKGVAGVYRETSRKQKQTKSIITLGLKVILYFVRLSRKIKGFHAQSSIRSILTFGC
jgi:ATP-dependent Clp protease adaptor protein ClpS